MQPHHGAAFYLDAISASALMVGVIVLVVLSYYDKSMSSHYLAASLPLTGLFIGLMVAVGCCAGRGGHR